MQTGGDRKNWSFDPQTAEAIPAILKQIVVYDEYFQEDDPLTVLASILDQLLAELPAELGDPVRLIYLTGLSYRAAGETLGIDHKTVKKRANLGVEQLRTRLTDTAWVASMLTGMLPEETVAPRLETSDKVVSILNALNGKKGEDDGSGED
jgi:hypothetical protein